jgi:hypothetical protein
VKEGGKKKEEMFVGGNQGCDQRPGLGRGFSGMAQAAQVNAYHKSTEQRKVRHDAIHFFSSKQIRTSY